MTLPVNTRVQVRRHWLVEGWTGVVVEHRQESKSKKHNDVRLDKQWVPDLAETEACRHMYFADDELQKLNYKRRKVK